jgi:hypothetical protein
MGVPGLLPALRPSTKGRIDFVAECRGQTSAFDGHTWLHSFCLVHYEAAVLRKEYDVVTQAVVRRAQSLEGRGLHVVIILDGQRMPGKSATDAERAKLRAAKLAEATQVTDSAQKARLLKAAIAITPQLVDETIAALRRGDTPLGH